MLKGVIEKKIKFKKEHIKEPKSSYVNLQNL
jgi:hypothetical protein